MNKDAAYDCGKPRGWIKKVGWKGGDAKWPGAYQAVRNFKIDNATMGALIVKIDLEGGKLEDVVAQWLKENEATWKTWTQ
jgi:glycine betaine/proline transport system substrate-binding protein